MVKGIVKKIFLAAAFILLGYFNSFSQGKETNVDHKQCCGQPAALYDYHARTESSSPEITYLVNGAICTKEEVYSLNPKKIISVEYLPPSIHALKLYGERGRNGLFIIETSKKPFLKRKRGEGIREIQIFLANAINNSK